MHREVRKKEWVDMPIVIPNNKWVTDKRLVLTVGAILFALIVLAGRQVVGQSNDAAVMSFSITSQGRGNGADPGGLSGADAHCQTLAAAVGAGDRTWRAYLSTAQRSGVEAVNARDRIGTGPWLNAAGAKVADNMEELHGDNNLTKGTALDEQGQMVNGRSDSPNRHDIITGSQLDGTTFPEGEELTCDDWTVRTMSLREQTESFGTPPRGKRRSAASIPQPEKQGTLRSGPAPLPTG